MWRGAAL